MQHQILRIGLYELLELGAPPHVVNEHVELAKALVFPGAAGFTNGGHLPAVSSLFRRVFDGLPRLHASLPDCPPHPTSLRTTPASARESTPTAPAGSEPARGGNHVDAESQSPRWLQACCGLRRAAAARDPCRLPHCPARRQSPWTPLRQAAVPEAFRPAEM